MSIEEAKELGATFLENTKYGPKVRVVSFPGVAIDLCGGTHVKNTKDIEIIKLLNIEQKGAGVYRITGVSGQVNTKLVSIKRNKEQIDKFTELNEKKYHATYSLLTNLIKADNNFVEFKSLEKELKTLYLQPQNFNLEEDVIILKEKLEELTNKIMAKVVEIRKNIVETLVNLLKEQKLVTREDISSLNYDFPIEKGLLFDVLKKVRNKKLAVIKTNDTIVLTSERVYISKLAELANAGAYKFGLKGKAVVPPFSFVSSSKEDLANFELEVINLFIG